MGYNVNVVRCWGCGGVRPERGPCPTCKPERGELAAALGELEKARAQADWLDRADAERRGRQLAERVAAGPVCASGHALARADDPCVRCHPPAPVIVQAPRKRRARVIPKHDWAFASPVVAIHPGETCDLTPAINMAMVPVAIDLIGSRGVLLTETCAGHLTFHQSPFGSGVPFGTLLQGAGNWPRVSPGSFFFCRAYNPSAACERVHVVVYGRAETRAERAEREDYDRCFGRRT